MVPCISSYSSFTVYVMGILIRQSDLSTYMNWGFDPNHSWLGDSAEMDLFPETDQIIFTDGISERPTLSAIQSVPLIQLVSLLAWR